MSEYYIEGIELAYLDHEANKIAFEDYPYILTIVDFKPLSGFMLRKIFWEAIASVTCPRSFRGRVEVPFLDVSSELSENLQMSWEEKIEGERYLVEVFQIRKLPKFNVVEMEDFLRNTFYRSKAIVEYLET